MKTLRNHFVIFAVAFLAACTPSGKEEANSSGQDTAAVESQDATAVEIDENAEKTAKATISSASESSLTGEAVFTDLGDGKVSLKLTVENATPGEHAVHLHEKGDCSAADATSAGGHWNPDNQPHGKRPENGFHAGDIDNLEVGEDGKGELNMTVTGWSVGGADSTNVINKAVIIHALPDDFKSQPSGAAGKRVGCGVVEKS